MAKGIHSINKSKHGWLGPCRMCGYLVGRDEGKLIDGRAEHGEKKCVVGLNS